MRRAGENRGRLIGVFAVTCAWAAVAAPQALADSFVVNSNADPGGDGVCTLAECTLREAISAAGGTEVVEDTITFSFPASTTISVDSELPAVTADITIDATTVTGYASGSRVVLDGTELAAGDGLHLAGDNGKVTGLVVNDFPNVGILVNGSGAVLDELRVGTDEVGAMDEGNGGHGIAVVGQPVGTSVEITDSLISGNGGNGVWINSNNVALGASVLRNNTIGMNATGTAPIPNDGAGVSIEALTGNASST